MTLGRALYTGAFVHCKSLSELDICPKGTIGVDENGKIAFITRNADDDQAALPDGWQNARTERLDGEGFFFPGFIGNVITPIQYEMDDTKDFLALDTYIHASQYPNAGIFGKSTLLDWLNTYTFPLESSFKDVDLASKVYNRVVARTLSHGTTTACYHATIHVPATNLLADICQSRGQRAFVGRVCMDLMSPDYYRDESVESSARDSKACIDHVRKIDPQFDLVTPVITPRFAPSCSDEVLKALGKLHKDSGVPCQTHIAENKLECELVRELFPNSKSYTSVYDDAGLLTSKTILAHCIYLSADERALIRDRGAKVSHCPASNTALTSGAAKVRQLLDEGLTVGLGTDVSGGYTPSILAEAREAIFVSRHVAMNGEDNAKLSFEEALYLATRGGAKVVGLEHRIGGFEVGKDWDAQRVTFAPVGNETTIDQTLGPVEIFGGESWEDKVAKWVYTGDDRNTAAVWVKGRLVHNREK